MKKFDLMFVCLVTFPTFVAMAQGDNPFGTPIVPKSYSVTRIAGAEAEGGGQTDFDKDEQLVAESVFNSVESASSSADSGGDNAQSTTNYSAMFSLDTQTGVLSGNFTSSSEATATDSPTGLGFPSANAASTFDAKFYVESASATIGFEGNMSASAAGGGSVGQCRVFIQDGDFTEFILIEVNSIEGPPSMPVAQTVQVPSGDYRLFMQSAANASSGKRSGGKGSGWTASANLNVNVTIEETDFDEIVWIGEDGNFDEATNWSPERVPTGGDAVRFHDSNITPVDVTFDSEQLSDRIILSDEVRFLNSVYTLGTGSETEPVVAISPTSASNGSLALVGNRINCGYASIAEGNGSNGTLSVIDGGFLNCSQILMVGESGMGTLDIGFSGQGDVDANELRIGQNAQSAGSLEVNDEAVSEQSELETGTTSVGYFGNGTLIVEDAQIETGQTSIGALFGSIGTVELKGGAGSSEWTYGGELRVGDQGIGQVTVSSGKIQSLAGSLISVAHTEGASGTLTIRGIDSSLETLGSLKVGSGGDGTIHVENGAKIEVDDTVDIGGGNATGGKGSAFVGYGIESPPQFSQSSITVDELKVGDNGRGILSVERRAYVQAQSASFGSDTGGNATVWISRRAYIDANLDVEIGHLPLSGEEPVGHAEVFLDHASNNDYAVLKGNRIFLREGSSVNGRGILKAPNRFFNMGGMLSTSVQVNQPFKQETDLNGLRIEGDFTMEGGVLEIAAFGLGANEHGIIEVTGEADIQSATIHFIFQDGFLPKTDDEIPFFMAEGALTVGTLAFTYEGAAPGFQFDVKEENGMFLFHALNDAQPEGGGPTPLPTALNPNADVNGDKVIDANDLLEVMQNWYRVVTE